MQDRTWTYKPAADHGLPPSERIKSVKREPGFMSVLGFAAAHGKVCGWWLVAAYGVLTLGEVLIYGTGLELAFSAAPDSMKGFVTACSLLTNTLGNLVNSLWVRHFSAELNPDHAYLLAPGPFFLATAAMQSWTLTVLVCGIFDCGLKQRTLRVPRP